MCHKSVSVIETDSEDIIIIINYYSLFIFMNQCYYYLDIVYRVYLQKLFFLNRSVFANKLYLFTLILFISYYIVYQRNVSRHTQKKYFFIIYIILMILILFNIYIMWYINN